MSVPAPIDHKYIIQSLIFTMAKYDYSIYEKRILYRLVEYAQAEIAGIKIKDNMHSLHHTQSDVVISMPIASVLVPGETDTPNKHYNEVKKACKGLGTKYFEWEDEKGNYRGDNIIYNIHIEKGTGIMNFHVVDWIWEAILDFSKGYRKFDLAIAMMLRSLYSMRFFEMMAGQKTPLDITVSDLRKQFRLEDKYKQINDLQKRILQTAQEELNKVSPYSFEFKANYVGKKIVSYTFFPVHIDANEDKKLIEVERQAKITARFQLDQSIYDYLKYSCQFKVDEINKNKRTLLEGQKRIANFLEFIADVHQNAIKSGNAKAYIIGAVKRKLNDIAMNEVKEQRSPRAASIGTGYTANLFDINNI